MKAVLPVIASNRVPYLQMRSVGSHSRSGDEKEGKKKRTGSLSHFIQGLVIKSWQLSFPSHLNADATK